MSTRKVITSVLCSLALFLVLGQGISAQIPLKPSQASTSAALEDSVATSEATVAEPTSTPSPNLAKSSEESLGELERLLNGQEIGPVWPFNPIKYAIRLSIFSGVSANTIVLLLLLPVVALTIAAARHIIGIRGFGIFLPAALSVVLIETGPVLGLILFLVIVTVSTALRIGMRRLGVKLQYLPRMSFVLWTVVVSMLGVLFLSPLIQRPELTSVSIFPILILILLSEDFSKVQLGKSAKVAVSVTTETIVLALVSYIVLTTKALQTFAILQPELFLAGVVVGNYLLGRYSGLRLRELWRFRQLLGKE